MQFQIFGHRCRKQHVRPTATSPGLSSLVPAVQRFCSVFAKSNNYSTASCWKNILRQCIWAPGSSGYLHCRICCGGSFVTVLKRYACCTSCSHYICVYVCVDICICIFSLLQNGCCNRFQYKLCGRPPQYAPCDLDLLTLKVVSESRVTTSVPILVFLGISVRDLGPMYVTDRRQTSIIT